MIFYENTYRKYLLLFYIIINIYFSIYFVVQNELGGDFFSFNIRVDNDFGMLMALFFVIMSFLYNQFIFSRVSHLTFSRINSNKVSFSGLYHAIFFVLIMLYVFSIINYNLGVAGSVTDSSLSPVLRSLLANFNPMYFFIIYLFLGISDKSKIFRINILLILILPIIKAYIGFLLFVFVFFVIRKIRFNGGFLKVGVFSIILLLSVFFSLPILRIIKVLLMYKSEVAPVSLFYSLLGEHQNSFIILYLEYFNVVLERFQHVANVYWIYINQDYFNLYLDNNLAALPIMEGGVQSFIYKIFIPDYPMHIQQVIAESITGTNNWRSQVGMFGWFLINPIYGILVSMYVLVIHLILKAISDFSFLSKNIYHVNYIITILIVVHGWFNDVIVYVLTLLLFVVFNFLLFKLKLIVLE